MQVISLRERSNGPGGEYVLIEWRGIPDNFHNKDKNMHTFIYYLNTNNLTCTKINKEEIAKFYSFFRRKEDKMALMLAFKFMQ